MDNQTDRPTDRQCSVNSNLRNSTLVFCLNESKTYNTFSRSVGIVNLVSWLISLCVLIFSAVSLRLNVTFKSIAWIDYHSRQNEFNLNVTRLVRSWTLFFPATTPSFVLILLNEGYLPTRFLFPFTDLFSLQFWRPKCWIWIVQVYKSKLWQRHGNSILSFSKNNQSVASLVSTTAGR